MRTVLIFSLLACPTIAMAKKPVGISMSWGGLAYPKSLTPTDDGNAGFDLTTKATLDFGWKLGKGKLIPYLTVYTQRDTAGYTYNAKEKITVGIDWEHKITKHAKLSFGANYAHDYRSLTGDNYAGFGLASNYSLYRSWPKENGARVILSGWANAKYPGSVEPSNRHNLIAQGRFTLAREKQMGDSKFYGAGFTAIGLFKDTDKKEYNNKVQLDFGLRLKRKIKKTNVTVSVKYRLDHRFESEKTYSGVILGLNWFSKNTLKPKDKTAKSKAKNWFRKRKSI